MTREAGKPWLHPEAVERSYTALLTGVSRRVQRIVLNAVADRKILSQRTDDMHADGWSDALSQMFLELLAEILPVGQAAVLRLRDTFTLAAQFNDRQWRVQVKAGTGVDIGPSGALPLGARTALGSVSSPGQVRAVFGVGVDVYRSEPWLVPLQNNWIAENTRLIKSIPAKYMADVEQVIRSGVMNGLSASVIAKNLQSVAKASEQKARLIAADQIGKANAALTKHRQQELGVSRYKWMSSHDARVRPTHRATDGHIYDWKKGPTITGGNHPGMEVRCRCWAKPILIDLDRPAESENPQFQSNEG